MEEFIARGNIKRFKAQLRASSDEHQKTVLRNLLHAEQQHLKSILGTKEAGVADLR